MKTVLTFGKKGKGKMRNKKVTRERKREETNPCKVKKYKAWEVQFYAWNCDIESIESAIFHWFVWFDSQSKSMIRLLVCAIVELCFAQHNSQLYVAFVAGPEIDSSSADIVIVADGCGAGKEWLPVYSMIPMRYKLVCNFYLKHFSTEFASFHARTLYRSTGLEVGCGILNWIGSIGRIQDHCLDWQNNTKKK